MDHSHIIELLPAYVDQELGIADTLMVQRHLDECQECRRDCAQQLALSKRIRKEISGFKATPELVSRISNALPPEPLPQQSARAPSNAGARVDNKSRWHFDWLRSGTRMASLASILVAVCSIGLYVNLSASLPSAQERMTEEIVSSHVRSLQADHLTDVASTDQHTVKPWFNGKLDFSPPVIDLASQGFVLEGGRLDYLDGHPVAALIYRRQKHPINLYLWPADGKDAGPRVETRQGYHLVRWTTDEMNYWAISDVAESDLLKFSAILRLAVHQ